MDRHIPMPERVAGFQAFYRRENTHPLLGFFLGSEYPVPRYSHASSLPEGRPLVADDFDPQGFAEDEAGLFDTHERCGGYFIHAGSAYWGIPWVEALLGCEIRVNHGTGSLYAEPLSQPATAGEWAPPQFDPESPWAKAAGMMLEAIEEESAGRFPLGTTRMRGVADMLVAAFGGENLIVAMTDSPEHVHAVAEGLTDLYINFGQFQLERIPEFYGGVGSFYYSMWAPPGTVWHQEDSCMLLSPPLYDEFIRPRDQRIFDAFDHNIVHFHSTGGYLPIEPVLKIGPTAIELHRDSGGPSAEELCEKHRQILAEAPLLIWGQLDKADLEWIFSSLPPEGLAVQAVVEQVEDAHEIWDRYGGNAR